MLAVCVCVGGGEWIIETCRGVVWLGGDFGCWGIVPAGGHRDALRSFQTLRISMYLKFVTGISSFHLNSNTPDPCMACTHTPLCSLDALCSLALPQPLG